jgi:hypothetical protein
MVLLLPGDVMRDTTRYDLFKEDLAGNPCWIESVEGLVEAVIRMDEFAASEPRDYFLFCAQTGKVAGRLRRQPGVMSANYEFDRKAS